MKTRMIAFSILIIVLCVSAGRLGAHHGTGISYDLVSNPVALKGTVTEFRWLNPHVSIFMDVKGPDGKVVNWSIEGNSIIGYARQGFNRNTLKPGMEVTALVYPSKIKNNPAAVIAKVTLPDGKEVLRFQRDTPGGRGID
jgi:hypothetical protein